MYHRLDYSSIKQATQGGRPQKKKTDKSCHDPPEETNDLALHVGIPMQELDAASDTSCLVSSPLEAPRPHHD